MKMDRWVSFLISVAGVITGTLCGMLFVDSIGSEGQAGRLSDGLTLLLLNILGVLLFAIGTALGRTNYVCPRPNTTPMANKKKAMTVTTIGHTRDSCMNVNDQLPRAFQKPKCVSHAKAIRKMAKALITQLKNSPRALPIISCPLGFLASNSLTGLYWLAHWLSTVMQKNRGWARSLDRPSDGGIQCSP